MLWLNTLSSNFYKIMNTEKLFLLILLRLINYKYAFAEAIRE